MSVIECVLVISLVGSCIMLNVIRNLERRISVLESTLEQYK